MSLDRTNIPKQFPIEAPTYWQVDKRLLKQNTPLHFLSKEDELLSSITLVYKGGFTSTVNGLDLGLMKSMILSETENYKNSSISEELDFYGAYFQLTPNYENIEIQLICLNRYLSKVIPLIKEIISNALFKQKDFDVYIDKKRQHFEISKKKVAFIGRTHFMNSLFGDQHIYGKMRELDDYTSIGLNDVKLMYDTAIKDKPFELFLSGKFTEDDILFIEEMLISQKQTPSETKRIENNIIQQDKTINIELKDAMQSSVTVGFSCPNSSHPDFLKWKVVNTILGGYFGSRLMKNIREDKGYTYGISSRLAHYKDSGMFKVSTEVGSQHVEDTLHQIYFEINKMKTELISEDELNLVKNYLLGGVLQSSDGIMQQATMYKNLYFQGFSWSRMYDFITVIKSITAQDILDLSNQFFIEKNYVEVVAGIKRS